MTPFPAWVRLVREPLNVPAGHATVKIAEPENAVRILKPLAEVELVEVFWVILLDSQSHVIGVSEVTRGLLNATLIHPREVFRLAIAFGAAGIIVAHNHPSGDPTPSSEDRAAVSQLVAAGRLLDVPVYDSLILAGNTFVSFATAGLMV